MVGPFFVLSDVDVVAVAELRLTGAAGGTRTRHHNSQEQLSKTFNWLKSYGALL